jgi:hypothetical protein
MSHGFAKVATLVASFTLCATVFAQKTKTVDYGLTTVSLSSTFTGALSDLNVTPGTVSPTRLHDGKVDFPITGGAIDLDTAEGNILHSGGLTLEAGGIQVKLQSFIIDTTGTAPIISGLVVAQGKLVGRLPLFDLAVPAGITPLKPQYGGLLALDGIPVTLDPAAAAALNEVYSTTAFAGGLSIGTANVDALLASDHWHSGW